MTQLPNHDRIGGRRWRYACHTVAAAISLLVCIIVCGLALASYAWDLEVTKFRHNDGDLPQTLSGIGVFEAEFSRGRCEILVEFNTAYMSNSGRWEFVAYPITPAQPQLELTLNSDPWLYQEPDPRVHRMYLNHGGFAFARDDINEIGHDYYILFPLWPIVLLMIVPVIAWTRVTLKRRRLLRVGRCRSCSYDLRASPGRCPECGAMPAGAST